ncbi:MAG: sulfatase-like hydrolase/transferase [Chloroflexota bacterium]
MPPTKLHHRADLTDHPYSKDNRIGWLAPDFDFEDIDMVLLDRSVAFLENHAAEWPNNPFFLFYSMQGVHLPSFPGKDFVSKTNAGSHSDFIFKFDYVVGELLNTLERLGLTENTIVMVTSDNGPEVTSVVHTRQDYDHDGARPWRGACYRRRGQKRRNGARISAAIC